MDQDDLDWGTPRLGKRKSSSRRAPRSPDERHSPASTLGGGGGGGGGNNSNCRYDSSLGMLTKKFVNLIERAEDGILDLNQAADILQVQKRRIYDITNVLEGVGLIEKKSKNNILWKPLVMEATAPSAADTEAKEAALESLRAQTQTLREHEAILDSQITSVMEAIRAMTEHPANKPYLYVTDDDITGLPCFARDTIFAVKAPKGTTLEMPDPTEAMAAGGPPHYRIVLRSKRDSVDVFLVQHAKSGIGQPAQPPTTGLLPATGGGQVAVTAAAAAAAAECAQVQAAAEAAAAQALRAAEEAAAAAATGTQTTHSDHQQHSQQAQQQQLHFSQQGENLFHQSHLQQQQQQQAALRPRAGPPPPLFPPEQPAAGSGGGGSAQPSPITALLARAMSGGGLSGILSGLAALPTNGAAGGCSPLPPPRAAGATAELGTTAAAAAAVAAGAPLCPTPTFAALGGLHSPLFGIGSPGVGLASGAPSPSGLGCALGSGKWHADIDPEVWFEDEGDHFVAMRELFQEPGGASIFRGSQGGGSGAAGGAAAAAAGQP